MELNKTLQNYAFISEIIVEFDCIHIRFKIQRVLFYPFLFLLLILFFCTLIITYY